MLERFINFWDVSKCLYGQSPKSHWVGPAPLAPVFKELKLFFIILHKMTTLRGSGSLDNYSQHFRKKWVTQTPLVMRRWDTSQSLLWGIPYPHNPKSEKISIQKMKGQHCEQRCKNPCALQKPMRLEDKRDNRRVTRTLLGKVPQRQGRTGQVSTSIPVLF